jgi:adenosylcobinamide-phosphate synthase
MSPFAARAGGAALGLLADRVLGEPPAGLHPVAGFGQLMQAVESRWYGDRRGRGVAHAALGLLVGAGAGAALRSTTAATYLAVAGRELASVALGIGAALEAGDVDRARAALPSLVGRDPSGLDEKEIARAVVESVAENTVDAVVAPALWAATAGAPGVSAHRAINTMDAMVGHRNERYARFGWAAARLDDVAAWVPARATAALVAAVRPRSAGAVIVAVRRDAPAHPSPNSGVAEAAFAAALGLRLGGESRYGERVELRPALGSGRPPGAADVRAAVRLSRDVGAALGAALAALSVASRVRRHRGTSG